MDYVYIGIIAYFIFVVGLAFILYLCYKPKIRTNKVKVRSNSADV